MEIFEIKNLSFRYPETGVDVLENINFSIKKGEFITLCGPSGCGKSTLLRNLKPALAPNGIKTGEILFCGQDLHKLSIREQSSKIGYVLQSPDNQIVTDKVWHELAFGLESLGYDNQTIRKRVAETASFFGIQNWFDKSVTELSGGQKQILNLASIMAMQPEVLILDEPTSQLDPIAAADFLANISKINRELGTTIIITEHRLDEILPISSKVLVIESGKIIAYETPKNIGKKLKAQNSKTFLSLPSYMRIWESVGVDDKSDCPITVSQGREWLEIYADHNKLIDLYPEKIPDKSEQIAVSLKNIYFRYEKDSDDVIKGLSLDVSKGEFVAILGGNGTGKSTTLSIISGINIPYRGEVKLLNDTSSKNDILVAQLPQNPQTLFVKKTVLEDLFEIFDGRKITKEDKEKRFKEVISLCKLQSFLQRHPYDLSGGEQQRVALAKMLLLRPQILLLDEPTKGVDAEFKIIFAKIVRTLTKSGVTVIMVSHDIEFCAKYAHRCMMFFNGDIVSEGTPRKFFASNSFYVTTANRMSRSVINNAVTADDVIYCCTGKLENSLDDDNINLKLYDSEFDFKIKSNKVSRNEKLPLWKKILGFFSALLLVFGLVINLDYIKELNSKNFPLWINILLIGVPIVLLMISFGSKSKCSVDEIRTDNNNRKLSKRTLVATVLILLAIPFTIFIGATYLQDKKYLFISLLVLFECMIPFFLIFEGRKPQARELIIIAVLCAIAVAGRTAFFMLPQFKPLIALVIISGIAFGAESGFMVGAVSMLVSNIMFQQGPWTPWQMFSAGIIGFIAGVLFKKGLLSRNRGALCVFGFFVTLMIYGGIMNFESAVMAHSVMNLKTVLSFYVTGLPMDIVHSLATFVFLFFGAEPMLEKLDRIKVKYGLIKA
ncbi:MAG: energy-coupling factor transporter ATPase [Ruminococcus sp.]|nr:energy-coupling factor transporter ATPase [Ruminococcus sp.]